MFLKKLQNSQESVLVKMQVSNLQSEALIKEETPAQVFSCEYSKSFKNTFLIELLRSSVILNCYSTTLNLLCTFHQLSEPFNEFPYQTQ